MADVPKPVTSPPSLPYQPYDATESGPGQPGQSRPTQVYDGNGMPSNADWPKVQEAGAASMTTGEITGGWPSDGTSDGRAWKQC